MKGISILCLLYSLCVLSHAASDLLVQTTNGPVLGHSTAANKRWLGIPFAAPPVGNLRFQPPRPVSSWTNPIEASAFAPICVQTMEQLPPPVTFTQSEDCLYLNVFTPLHATPSSNLPVFIYIFGGAWRLGYTGKYEGSFMAGQDIVVVSISYRVGALGFMAHPALLNHAPENTTGMYGIQDQRAGLQWVKQNIARFGGNPNDVTLGGQSAGAGTNCVHLAAPRSAGLFHKAIMQSTFCGNLVSEASSYNNGNTAARLLGCNKTTDAETLQCLLNTDAQSFVATAISTPALNSYEILQQPTAIFRSGNFNKVPLIIGNTHNESNNNFCNNPAQVAMTPEQYAINVQNGNPSNYQALLEAYPLSKYPSPVSAFAAIAGDRTFRCPGKAAMDAYSGQFPHVWTYSFEQPIANPGIQTGDRACLGAFHGLDNYYFYPSYLAYLNSSFTPAEQEFSQKVRNIWVSFVKSGVPTLPTYQTWPRYTFNEGKYAVLSAASFHIASDYKVNECPALGVPSPTCTASVALVARPGNSWVANGQNHQVYEVKVNNVGDKKIKALNVLITPGGQATITQKWNLNQVSGNVHSLPEWYQGFNQGGQSTDAGFILAGPASLSPSVSVSSISC